MNIQINDNAYELATWYNNANINKLAMNNSITVSKVHETEKAICVLLNEGIEIWIPKKALIDIKTKKIEKVKWYIQNFSKDINSIKNAIDCNVLTDTELKKIISIA